MTSSTANRPNVRSRIRRRAGFTLVEMLVVIGIILALMGILLPSLGRVWTQSVRTRMTADMQAIGTALEAYKQDHGDYPRVYSADTGAHQLCRALISPAGDDPAQPERDGYGDPADSTKKRGAPGFRTRAGGKVYPAYLPVERFKLVDPLNTSNPTPDLYKAVIGDRYGKPILYYPANKLAKLEDGTNGGYVRAVPYVRQDVSGAALAGPRPMFNANDNLRLMPTEKLQLLLGEYAVDPASGALTSTSTDGKIDAGETPAFTGPYLLWSAGPDEKYGPEDAAKPIGPGNPADDVANFPRAEY